MAKLITPLGFTVLVDREDIPKILEYNLNDHFYLICQKRVNGRNIVRWLHHVVLDIEKIEKGSVVDHVNGNPLDCRKSNLRVCTIGQNNLNKRSNTGCRYKGVRKIRISPGRVRFEARVQLKGKKWSNRYDSEEEAVKAYNRMARKWHGEFARLNVWTGPSFRVKKSELKPQRRGVYSHRRGCRCPFCEQRRRSMNRKRYHKWAKAQKADKGKKNKC